LNIFHDFETWATQGSLSQTKLLYEILQWSVNL
jgi:hypothetical protein